MFTVSCYKHKMEKLGALHFATSSIFSANFTLISRQHVGSVVIRADLNITPYVRGNVTAKQASTSLQA